MYKKFEYKKWVTENKFGLLLEQTGSGTGSGNPSTGSGNPSTGSGMQVCYGCVNNQTVNSGGIQFNVQSNGYCGTMSNQGVTTTYYYPQTHSQLANCGIPPSTGSGSGSGSAVSSSCNPSSWSNYSNWINNILPNNGAFSSPNPNQPCQFLCNRISAITNQIPTVGPNWANQLECKIEEFQNQSQVNNYSC